MSTSDPLEALLVDARELDRERIAGALRGRLALDETTSLPLVLPGFFELDGELKILAVLLLLKAGVLLERLDNGAAAPAELAQYAAMPSGTVRRLVRELVESRRVSQNSDRRYFLSSAQVGLAVESLTSFTDAGQRLVERASKQTTTGSNAKTDLATTDRRKYKGAGRSSRTVDRSPTALVRELISANFFASPRSLAETQQRLRDKTGHQIPVTTLSPVLTRLLRSGMLDREQGEKGVYLYVMTDKAASSP